MKKIKNRQIGATSTQEESLKPNLDDIDRVWNIKIDLDQDYSDKMRKLQYEMDRASSLTEIVPYLFESGQISFEEWKKWILDPRGLYCPKLRNQTK